MIGIRDVKEHGRARVRERERGVREAGPCIVVGERQEMEEEYLRAGPQLWDHQHCLLF